MDSLPLLQRWMPMARRSLHPFLARSLAASTVVMLASACSDGGPGDPGHGGADAALQVVNGAATAIGVRVDGQLVLPALLPGAISHSLAVAAGSHTVSLESDAGSSATTVQVGSGQIRTVTATGLQGALDARLLPDTASVPAPGTVKLRVLHLAAGAPAVSVWRTQPGVDGAFQVMFPFAYGSESSFLQGEPGSWRVWVAPVQTIPPATPGDTATYAGTSSPELASSGPIVLAAGDVRTVALLRGTDGQLRVQLLPVLP